MKMILVKNNNILMALELFILMTFFVLIESAPQNYYNPYSYYGYYPYRRSGYSRKPQTQAIKRQSTGGSVNNYSQHLLNDLNASLNAQNERDKINKKRISKADEENAKFAGANNQETEEESSRTAALLFKNRYRRCFPFGRDAAATANTKSSSTSTPKEQGRFLFDLNVYNVYPNGGAVGGGAGYGCGGGLGGGLLGGGGGLLSDVLGDPYPPPATPLQNFLTLFAPGILQNALAATVPPRPQIPLQSDQANLNSETDPGVDPNYNPRPIPPIRRPNRIYYDSAGAAPITPAQLVGGVATTINGIIQQLTGNVQPVYPSYRG